VINRQVVDVFPEFGAIFNFGIYDKQIRSRMGVVIQGNKKQKIHLGCSSSPLRDKEDKIIGSILIFQNLTEIKLMEETLEKSKRLALIGEMAAGLAHEMRNPLASITGSIELLKQGLKLKDTDERLMKIILRSKDQLDSFVRDFLLLARPIPLNSEMVDINSIISDILESLKLSADWMADIKINCSLGDGVIIFANREQIRQVINNLVLNAIQAMKEGGILSILTRSMKHHDREVIEINVGDTGMGIEEKDMEKVFEPFFTKKHKGTGLGLTIVSRIVDGYGGRIHLESGLNRGTVCRVWLPSRRESVV